MIYLTPAQVLFIHARLLAETGGASGIRDIGLLASAVARPQATFGGQDLYFDLFHKTAALMESIVRNHPFVDGNKRVGLTSAAPFLKLNGRQLIASNAEVEQFSLSVAEGKLPLEAIATWFEQFSEAQSQLPEQGDG